MINRYANIKQEQIEDSGGYDEELDDLIEQEEERLMEAAIDRMEFDRWFGDDY